MRRSENVCPETVKVRVASPPQIVLGLGLFALGKSHLSEMIVDFPQPPRVRRFVDVLHAPGQLALRCLPLMEEAGKLGVDDAGNPVHNADSGRSNVQLLCGGKPFLAIGTVKVLAEAIEAFVAQTRYGYGEIVSSDDPERSA
jgi:hypothetical protein